MVKHAVSHVSHYEVSFRGSRPDSEHPSTHISAYPIPQELVGWEVQRSLQPKLLDPSTAGEPVVVVLATAAA